LFLPHWIIREHVKEEVLDNEQASFEFGKIHCICTLKKEDGVWGWMARERDQVSHLEHPSLGVVHPSTLNKVVRQDRQHPESGLGC
jgi:hypothetical protein